MAIFGIIECDLIVQENEKIRIDCTKSFFTPDESAVTVVEVEPYAGAGFIDITPTPATDSKSYYLDYVYATSGTKTISLRITTGGSPETFTTTVSVVTAVEDALFSSDNDLKAIEPDVMKWLPKGKSTWNFVHRKVQEKIVNEIYKNRILSNDGTKLTKDEFIDVDEVKEWAVYYALSIIFYSISNSVDDIFAIKSQSYEKQKNEYMNLAMNILWLDYNKDGNLTAGEKQDFRSIAMVRR